jgi:hypothetical protein
LLTVEWISSLARAADAKFGYDGRLFRRKPSRTLQHPYQAHLKSDPGDAFCSLSPDPGRFPADSLGQWQGPNQPNTAGMVQFWHRSERCRPGAVPGTQIDRERAVSVWTHERGILLLQCTRDLTGGAKPVKGQEKSASSTGRNAQRMRCQVSPRTEPATAMRLALARCGREAFSRNSAALRSRPLDDPDGCIALAATGGLFGLYSRDGRPSAEGDLEPPEVGVHLPVPEMDARLGNQRPGDRRGVRSVRRLQERTTLLGTLLVRAPREPVYEFVPGT